MSKNIYCLTVIQECYFEVIEDREVDSWDKLETIINPENFEFPDKTVDVAKVHFLSKTVGPIPNLRTFRLTDGELVEEKTEV